MTDEAKALVDAVDRYVRVYTTGSSDGAKYRARKNLMDLIETQAREIERLRERVERMGRDKETLLTFARAIQTWRSDADSYDEECDHPQRDYCEDVELMEKAAGYALRRIAERTTLAGDSHDQ